MKRVNLTGVIVGPIWDQEWAQDYITKGVICPESHFKRQLAAVDEDAEIYVNSPGGSVFSGYEMANAANDWRAKTGKKLTVTVGGMAASAAANFLVGVNADMVSAHANTKVMFHGAAGVTEGQAGAHADTAALLEKINGEIKTKLVARHNLPPDTVEQWFSDGREGWLTAQEAKACKLVDGIIEEQSPVIRFPRETAAALAVRGLDIAAFCDGECNAVIREELANVPARPTDQAPPEPAAAGAGEDVADMDGDGDAEAFDAALLEVEYLTGEMESREADHAAEIAALTERHAAEIGKRDNLIREHQSAADKARAELARLNESTSRDAGLHAAELAALRAQLGRFVSTATTLPISIDTWEQAMADCGGDYAEARRKHPAAFAAAYPSLSPKHT